MGVPPVPRAGLCPASGSCGDRDWEAAKARGRTFTVQQFLPVCALAIPSFRDDLPDTGRASLPCHATQHETLAVRTPPEFRAYSVRASRARDASHRGPVCSNFRWVAKWLNGCETSPRPPPRLVVISPSFITYKLQKLQNIRTRSQGVPCQAGVGNASRRWPSVRVSGRLPCQSAGITPPSSRLRGSNRGRFLESRVAGAMNSEY